MAPSHPPRPSHFLIPLVLDSLSSPLDRATNLIREAVGLLLLPCGPRPDNLSVQIIVSCAEFAEYEHKPAMRWEEVQVLLGALYMAATERAHEADCPLLNVDVLFEEWCGHDPWLIEDENVTVVGYHEDQTTLAVVNTKRGKDQLSHLHFIPIEEEESPSASADTGASAEPSTTTGTLSSATRPLAYDNVAMGGTFDHLHAGHKILLTAAAWLTGKRLICGVMELDSSRLERKKGAKYMEPLDTRIQTVKKFLNLIRRDKLQYDVVPISDEYGPTRSEANIQAIVGSLETKKGCEAVNTLRANNKLPPLDVFTIHVLSPSATNVTDMELKISSSAIRHYLESRDAVAE
ncbi:hypothetical protein PhCBS80983_g02118 [Powellomyces hirtus]|uniref:Cytidyltransferase-like domain-containing protein n=1 Tax=Powellomyces hirtus TaxID=109895 RepID=A0A507E801_9FUNG|nr:hypothetical protein PhCBS80983_g02118 [Powellomyces hirtus]